MALPSSRRTSSGKERIAARAAGWKIAAFTRLMSHIWDMVSRRQGRPPKTTGLLGDLAGGFFEEFVDEGLASDIRRGIRCDQALPGAHGFCHCKEKAIVSAHARAMETAHRERPGNPPWKTADQGNPHSRRPGAGLLGRGQNFRGYFG